MSVDFRFLWVILEVNFRILQLTEERESPHPVEERRLIAM